MKSGIKIVIMVCMLLTSTAVVADFSKNKTIYVDDDNTEGPWDGSKEHPYQHIQDGINYAGDGDTVFVNTGFYVENVFIEKKVNLEGQGKEMTVIDGGGKHDCIYLTSKADGAVISGFTIQDSGNHSGGGVFDGGIDIHSDNNMIVHNIISNHPYNGINLRCSNHNNISFNIIQDNGRAGIEPEDSRYNQIYRNVFQNNSEWGVMFHSDGISNGNQVFENRFIDNFKGLALARQAGNEIFRNNFINNDGGHARSDFTLFSHSSKYINNWNANYWDDWNSRFPRFIPGFFSFDMDRHPRDIPYDFNGGL